MFKLNCQSLRGRPSSAPQANVPTLDRPVEMTIPAGSQAGQRMRLRQQGLKKRSGGRGDEFVKLKIVVPSSPTAREKELFEQLAAESRFKPREPLAGGIDFMQREFSPDGKTLASSALGDRIQLWDVSRLLKWGYWLDERYWKLRLRKTF